MKNIPVPFLRTFLLLTLCVGLLGNAKILLLQNNKVINQSLLASSNTFSKRSTTESLAQFTTRVSIEPLANIEASKNKEPVANKEALANVAQEPSVGDIKITSADVIKKPSADITNISSTVVTKEPSVAALIKPSTQSLETTSKDSLSELLTSNAINSTIESLENIIKDASNDSDYQEKISEPEKFKLPRFENGHALQNSYAFQNDLARQAEMRLQSNVTYDGRYLKIGYPMGDVPADIGVCTDVVIRAYRALGIDLQQRVHEDMKRNFRSYPNNWQLTRPDSNIDHRRVPNLMKYFKRAGASVAISNNPLDYHAGDIVAWDMGNGLTHIGIVSTYISEQSSNPLIVHNIGVGPEMTDILFDFKIIGHYKYGNGNNIKVFQQKMAKSEMNNLEAYPEGLFF